MLIERPSDPTRVVQLEAKLKEYGRRLCTDLPQHILLDTICKAFVLARVLQNGSVDTYELYDELKLQYGDDIIVEDVFVNACAVINDYCTTGGEDVHGGTGLSAV